jgi:hypothetical protein
MDDRTALPLMMYSKYLKRKKDIASRRSAQMYINTYVKCKGAQYRETLCWTAYLNSPSTIAKFIFDITLGPMFFIENAKGIISLGTASNWFLLLPVYYEKR